MRQAHYWKAAGASSAPSELVVFDCETWHGSRAEVPGGEFQTLRLGVAIAYRLERGRRTRCQKVTFRHPSEFWQFLRSRLNARRPVWCVGHNIAYDLGVVGAWGVLTSEEFECERACVTGQLFHLKGKLWGYPVAFVDSFNYYKASLASIGKNLGLPKIDFPDQSAPDAVWEEYCARDVEVTARAVDSLIAFIRAESLGPWQVSIAGLSFSAYRSRFMKHKTLVHNYRTPLEVERAAYYGGIVDTPYIGTVPCSPVYELDVCSMYPAVSREPVPIKFECWGENLSVADVRRIANNYMLCADVTLHTDDYPYPVRLKSGTYYPLGTYRTCLAHPELMHAIPRIVTVHSAAWYKAAPIFREYMEHFIGKKSAYRAEEPPNDTFAMLCKYYGNALYGKTGQLSPVWREWCEDSLQQIERNYGLPPGRLERYYGRKPHLLSFEETCELPDVPEAVEVRNYYGVVEVKCGYGESRDSCPVIAATITSYARQLLRRFQATAGAGHWFYSDTDSIWTSGEGFRRLWEAGCCGDDKLGYLDLKWMHGRLTVHGPKDYETYTVRKLKGVRASATPDGKGGWCQLQFPSALSQMRDDRGDGVFVRHVTKRTHRKLTRVKVGPDGWTRPLRFPAETPPR